MRKMVIGLLVCILAVSLLAGCGGQKGDVSQNPQQGEKQDSQKAKELQVWLPPFGTEDMMDQEVWEDIFKKFEQENNVKITLQIVPWNNYEDKYLTGISAGQGPDVGYMYAEMFPSFIDMGTVQPLDEYLTQEDRDNYYYLDKGIIFGKQYGLPIVVGNPRILCYNQDILDEIDVEPPATWEEFKDIAIKATKDTDGDGEIDRFGYVAAWGSKAYGAMNEMFYPWLWQAGGELFNEEGTQAAFNSEAGVKAVTFLQDLLLTHKVMPESVIAQDESEILTNYFGQGKAAFVIVDTRKTANIFDKQYPDLNWGYVTSLQDVQKGTFVAADQLVMLSDAPDYELTMSLMRYMTSAESMEKFHKMSPWPPIARDEKYNGNPKFTTLYENDYDALKNLKPVKNGYKIYDYLYKQLQVVMMGETTPEKALEEAEKYANDLLNQ